MKMIRRIGRVLGDILIKFSIVYQFHRLNENTTYNHTYNSTRDKVPI